MLLEGDDGYRLSDSRTARSTRRSRTSTCSTAASAGCSRWPTCCRARSAGRLHKWVEGGRYASLFDNLDDTLTVERLQVFDFEAMRAYPVAARAAAVLRAAPRHARIQDPAEAGTLKLCVMDEAWRFIQHPTLRAYVQEGAEDLAQAERRDDPGHPDHRRLRVRRSAAHGRRELPDASCCWRTRRSIAGSTPSCFS